jgi:chemotaxis protein MotB
VARFLQDKVGLDPTRLSATGYGEYRSVAPNDSEEGRAQNRRIEIILAPLPPATAAGG